MGDEEEELRSQCIVIYDCVMAVGCIIAITFFTPMVDKLGHFLSALIGLVLGVK